MTWTRPLHGIEVQRRILRKRDAAVMPDTSREVEIDGVRYRSMGEACRALKCSYSEPAS